MPSSIHAAPAVAQLERARPNDVHFSAVIRLVSAYQPFATYSLGLMVPRLLEQLAHGTGVLAVRGGQLAGYAGWLQVDAADAARWAQDTALPVPLPRWSDGSAAIVTVTVAHEAALLPLLLRGVSHLCAGLPVYRLRSFSDGRPAMRRPPIHGRAQAGMNLR